MTLAISEMVLKLLVAGFVVISVGLICIVLLQRPSGGGLGGAFGSGSGSGQTAFGTKTGDVLTGATILLFALWLLMAIGLNYASRPEGPPDGTAAVGADGEDAPEEAPGDTRVGAEVPPPAVPGGDPEDRPVGEPEPADVPEVTPERTAGPPGEGEGG